MLIRIQMDPVLVARFDLPSEVQKLQAVGLGNLFVKRRERLRFRLELRISERIVDGLQLRNGGESKMTGTFMQ